MASKQSLADAANDAVRLIAEATGKATAAIASAAQDAVKLLASDASQAAKVVADKADNIGHSGNRDHDLLVILDTKMEGLKCDIKDLKDGTSRRIETLELEKLNAKESYPVLYKKPVDDQLGDHEKRIRDNEKNINRIVTVGSVLVVVLNISVVLIVKFVH